jgi:Nitroreductase family
MPWFNTKMSRRKFLKLAGSGIAIVVIGGTVWRAFSNGVFSSGQGPAYEPWKDWKTESEEGIGPLSLVASAILAANAHNTQPWLFVVDPKRIDLFADTKRNIGTIDPFLREMYEGLGCSLENLVVAAEPKGYTYNLKLMPNPTSKTHVATISLVSTTKINNSRSGNNTTNTLSSNLSEPLSLYNSIPQRHTNRGPYDKNKPVTQDILQSLGGLSKTVSPEGAVTIFWFTTDDQRRKIRDLMLQATQAIIADPQQSYDDFKWYRANWQDIQTYKDGLTVDASGSPWYIEALAKILPPVSEEGYDSSQLQLAKDTYVATAAAFGIIAVRDVFDNLQRLQGGMFYQRMHLWATSNGLAMQPMNQITERADREVSLGIKQTFGNALRDLIANPNWQALMTFRIGYPTMEALSSPRRSIQEVVVASL